MQQGYGAARAAPGTGGRRDRTLGGSQHHPNALRSWGKGSRLVWYESVGNGELTNCAPSLCIELRKLSADIMMWRSVKPGDYCWP